MAEKKLNRQNSVARGSKKSGSHLMDTSDTSEWDSEDPENVTLNKSLAVLSESGNVENGNGIVTQVDEDDMDAFLVD